MVALFTGGKPRRSGKALANGAAIRRRIKCKLQCEINQRLLRAREN